MERIGDQVERTLRESGGGGALALTDVTRVWREAVGDAVSRQAWPARIARDGTLQVSTSSATWAYELDRLSGEILERLGVLLGDERPSGLRFRVGPVPEPGGDTSEEDTAAAEPPPLAPEDAVEAARAASEIEDPELREIVSRAARASLARGRLRPPFLVD